MFSRIFFSIAILLAITACTEDSPIIFSSPSIKIIEPYNNFHSSELDSLFIKISTDNENKIDYIELFAIDEDGWYDTSIAVFTFIQQPYETYLRMPEIICVENDLLTIYAKAYSLGGKQIKSENVYGFIIKDLPADNYLFKYDYQGFDLDSNLVVKGLLTIMMEDTIYNYIPIKGRRDLNPIDEDLAYEKGKGFTEGYINTIEDSYLRLTRCDMVSYNGIGNYNIDLVGLFTDSLFTGERHLNSMDPTTITVGTFIAVRRY
jgi:hypothetical protein